jgi:hypothetical protein
MTVSLDTFFQRFLRPPKGNSSEQIAERIRHWIDVCNHPERYSQDANEYAISAKRRTARQNLRRLGRKHPHIVAEIMREPEASQ